MRIGIDIDDTIFFYTEWVTKHKKAYPDLKYPQSLTSFYSKIPFNLSAVAVIKRLMKEGHEILFVTQLPYHLNINNIPCKIKRIIELFDESILNNMCFIIDKSLIKVDVLIDNNKHNISVPIIQVTPDFDWFDMFDLLEDVKPTY